MTETKHEATFYLSDLSKKLPDQPTYGTLLRWCTTGSTARGRLETPIVMESEQRPNGLASSVEAYQRFIQKLGDARDRDE